jgi:uncharacterized protein
MTSGPSIEGKRRFNVMVPMRDGINLATDVYLPPSDDQSPAILGRTPYTKGHPAFQKLVDAWNGRGYALVIQDVRGRGDSEGQFTPEVNEGPDGHDAVEWVATQPWSNGQVAIRGASYGAMSAWLAACERPPHLRALIVAASPSDPFVETPAPADTPMSVNWYRLVDGRILQNLDTVEWTAVYEHLPLETMDERAGFRSLYFREAVRHETLDEFWEAHRFQDRLPELDLPVLHISGWYDDELVGTPLNFTKMRQGRNPAGQRMLIGPWGHQVNTTRKLGEVDFGPEALIDLERYEADWLDSTLGRAPAQTDPPVRLFVMGSNTWRDESDWPVPGTRFTEFFLRSGGNANSRFGDGRLTQEAPTDSEPADAFTYDPARPVPFLTDESSAQIGGPDDYAAVEQRGDVLCYSSEALDEDVEVTGPVRVVLFASSSAVDTDFAAKLVDVHPSGFCQRLCDGLVRARYREGFDRIALLEPNAVYEFKIDLWSTSQVFKAGHRIRLEVTSSAFPKQDRNLNTGEPFATGTRMVTAENRVFHDARHPSRLILPIVPSGRA